MVSSMNHYNALMNHDQWNMLHSLKKPTMVITHIQYSLPILSINFFDVRTIQIDPYLKVITFNAIYIYPRKKSLAFKMPLYNKEMLSCTRVG